MISRCLAGTRALYLVGSVLTAGPLAGQTPYRVTRGPAELLAAWVHDRETLEDRSGASLELTHILVYHSTYPAPDVEALLNGLEDLALNSQLPRIQQEAVLVLGLPGSFHVARPLPETYSRLMRIYRTSEEALVRIMVISAIGDLAVRSRAAAFLEGVVARDPLGYNREPGEAVRSLVMMGDEGRAVLKRLHQSGAVQHPRTRYSLALLAQRGYRIK